MIFPETISLSEYSTNDVLEFFFKIFSFNIFFGEKLGGDVQFLSQKLQTSFNRKRYMINQMSLGHFLYPTCHASMHVMLLSKRFNIQIKKWNCW